MKGFFVLYSVLFVPLPPLTFSPHSPSGVDPQLCPVRQVSAAFPLLKIASPSSLSGELCICPQGTTQSCHLLEALSSAFIRVPCCFGCYAPWHCLQAPVSSPTQQMLATSDLTVQNQGHTSASWSCLQLAPKWLPSPHRHAVSSQLCVSSVFPFGNSRFLISSRYCSSSSRILLF